MELNGSARKLPAAVKVKSLKQQRQEITLK
jgi:hypothetical protein